MRKISCGQSFQAINLAILYTVLYRRRATLPKKAIKIPLVYIACMLISNYHNYILKTREIFYITFKMKVLFKSKELYNFKATVG